MHLNLINYSFNIEYIFIYLINHILNIYNFIFFLYLSFKFYLIIYVFFNKNEGLLFYKFK